ncbi:flagellar protein FlaG [Lysinibacillus fusiformis]|nr:flagellar protein FlaG [Lysinibacillus fusiformis]
MTQLTNRPVEVQVAKVSEERIAIKEEAKAQIQKEQEQQQEQEVPVNNLEKAVDSLNEIFKINNSELRFKLHEGLGKYYATLVDSETEEVVREIPAKKILDVFYEMQKLLGLFVDKKI